MTTHAVHSIMLRMTASEDMNDLQNAYQRTIDFNVSPGVLGKACLLKVRQCYCVASANNPSIWAVALDLDQPNHNSFCYPGTGSGFPNIVNQHIAGKGSIIALVTTTNNLNNSEHMTIPIQMQPTAPKMTISVFNPFNSGNQSNTTSIDLVLQLEIVPIE